MPEHTTYLAAKIVAEELPADRLKRLVEVVRDLDGADRCNRATVEGRVDALADQFPDARIVILGLWEKDDWFLIDVHKGQTRWVKVADSADRTDWVKPPRLEKRARVPVRLEPDDIKALARKGIDASRYLADGEVELATFDEDPVLLDEFVQALADRLAPSAPDRNLRVHTRQSPCWVMLAPGHSEVHTLYPHPVTVDARLKKAAGELLRGPGDIGITQEEIDRRLQADGAPEGATPEELRTMIKEARKAAHTRRSSEVPGLLEMLSVTGADDDLVEELRKHVFRGITWHDTPEVRRVLATAIADESDDVYKTIEHVMWRQRDFLSDWLPDELDEAEGEYRLRLIALREKHLGSR
jgi:hypothetical protein